MQTEGLEKAQLKQFGAWQVKQDPLFGTALKGGDTHEEHKILLLLWHAWQGNMHADN